MNLYNYITVSPETQWGKPVFKRTRVTVDTLFYHLEAGVGLDDFFENFHGVSKEQVQGVLESAARLFQSSKLEKINEIIA